MDIFLTMRNRPKVTKGKETLIQTISSSSGVVLPFNLKVRKTPSFLIWKIIKAILTLRVHTVPAFSATFNYVILFWV